MAEVGNSDEKDEPISSFKEKCANCIRGPNLIKTILVAGCTVLLIQQIVACFMKLVNKPITTYTHFDFNKTIMYPSVTFCKEPPYKYDKIAEYGLYDHPRFISTWLEFDFSRFSLDQLWEEITYNDTDVFVKFSLDGKTDNVELTATIGFIYGRCYTLTPKVASTHATRNTGYSITLHHSGKDLATSLSSNPPGYHVHIHYNREPFTEVDVYNGGLVDYFYVNTGDTIDVKLKVNQYVKVGTQDDPCSNEDSYSANECTSKCVWDRVGRQAGCSGPWMESNLPRCNNYEAIRDLITAYLSLYMNHSCPDCPRFCRSYLYTSYVTDRQTFYSWDSNDRVWKMTTDVTNSETNLYIYFNGMLVSVYEERYNYDWNMFLSDLGGSIGFLLGLSVIGLMSLAEQLWSKLIRPSIKTTKEKDIPNGPTTDLTINTQYDKFQEYLNSCTKWNIKNDFLILDNTRVK